MSPSVGPTVSALVLFDRRKQHLNNESKWTEQAKDKALDNLASFAYREVRTGHREPSPKNEKYGVADC